MSKSVARSLTVVLCLIAVYVADTVATHAVFTSRFPGANDFYSRWAGARAWWMQGLSPYSEEASRQIEIGIYGRRALPGEDPGPFAYPFYAVFLIAPLAFLPYVWAEAAWLALLQFALIGGILGSIRLVKWHIPPLLLGVTLISMVFFYHSARAILLGQFAVIVFALVAGMLLALQARRDLWAGVLLALATVKPQMVFLLVPLALWWAIATRRWRMVWGFAGAMAVLCGASWIAVPGWLGDFLTQMMRYSSYTAIGSPVWVITRYFFPGARRSRRDWIVACVGGVGARDLAALVARLPRGPCFVDRELDADRDESDCIAHGDDELCGAVHSVRSAPGRDCRQAGRAAERGR